jgi:dTDP-4-amino-4,6-dideoxygalactose transaminase
MIAAAKKHFGWADGDEVIVSPVGFPTTISPLVQNGLKPIFTDITYHDLNFDLEQVEASINSKTRAIFLSPVLGNTPDMDRIVSICEDKGIKLILDGCDSLGSKWKGKDLSDYAEVTSCSFYPAHHMTTGEGGMCVTNSEELDTKMRKLRDHGMSKEKRYWHDDIGFNYRMTNLQAAIGCAQLEKIEWILDRNDQIERDYIKHLDHLNLFKWQKTYRQNRKVVWLMSCTTEKRKEVMEKLVANNIDVRPFFYCLSEMPVYSKYSFSSKNARQISKLGMNLPTVKNIDYDRISEILATI